MQVPDLGEVRIQQFSARQRIDYLEFVRVSINAQVEYDLDQARPSEQREGVAKPSSVDTSHLAVLRSVVDENGARVFDDADEEELLKLGYPAVRQLFIAVIEINGLNASTSNEVETEKKD